MSVEILHERLVSIVSRSSTPVAEADLVEHSRHDATEAGAEVAERFFDAAIAAVHAVKRIPGDTTSR